MDDKLEYLLGRYTYEPRRCKCGEEMEIESFTASMKFASITCPKLRFWNFWKHDTDMVEIKKDEPK